MTSERGTIMRTAPEDSHRGATLGGLLVAALGGLGALLVITLLGDWGTGMSWPWTVAAALLLAATTGYGVARAAGPRTSWLLPLAVVSVTVATLVGPAWILAGLRAGQDSLDVVAVVVAGAMGAVYVLAVAYLARGVLEVRARRGPG